MSELKKNYIHIIVKLFLSWAKIKSEISNQVFGPIAEMNCTNLITLKV